MAREEYIELSDLDSDLDRDLGQSGWESPTQNDQEIVDGRM